jgi:signal transduction histidine kinase
VTIGCQIEDNQSVRICVADTGLGIPDNCKDRVFEPFDRLGAENSSVLGVGIGLSLTQKFIESMGGKVNFDSTEGQGSVFCIDLPLAETQALPMDEVV